MQALKTIGREAFGQGARGDRECDVADIRAGVDEPCHRSAAAELAVVGVRSEHERAFPGLDHATGSRHATAESASSAQKSGSSISAL